MNKQTCWYCQESHSPQKMIVFQGQWFHQKCRNDYVRVRKFWAEQKDIGYYSISRVKTRGKVEKNFQKVLDKINHE